MIRPSIPASLIALGCASAAVAASPGAGDLAAHLLKDEQPTLTGAATPLAHIHGNSNAPARPVHRVHSGIALTRVQAAKRGALLEPNRDGYVGAVQIYPWSEGALYRLYAAPGQVSDIALQPGESLVSVAAGDTVRWIIGDTTSGAGATRRTHVLVKPSAPGLATNLMIATDRRVYHIEAESNTQATMVGLSWTYPEGELLALHNNVAAAEESVAAGVTVDSINFDYRIEGDRPPWRPLHVFDDGHQVFILFPPALVQGEAPPLFVIGDGGRAELVNYRIRGLYYVVDRLFAAAELRLGEKHQQVVRIVRDAAGQKPAGRR